MSKPRVYRIEGRLVHRRTGRPLEGLRVEAWDKDLFFDDLVGSAVSDMTGAFGMAFDASYFQEFIFDRHPDLYFRVFAAERLVHDTRNAVLPNVRSRRIEVVLEVDLEPEAPAGTPTFTREDLLALFELADRTPARIGETSPELHAKLLGTALVELGRRLTDAFADADEPLRHAISGLSLLPLADPEASVGPFLQSQLKGEALAGTRVEELLVVLSSGTLPDTSAELLRPDVPIRENPLFEAVLRRGALLHVAGRAGLGDAAIEALLEADMDPASLDADRLSALVVTGRLTAEDARALLFHSRTLAWLEGNVRLTEAVLETLDLQGSTPADGIEGLAARITRSDLEAAMDAIGYRPPTGEPRTRAADRLVRGIERRFADSALRGRLERVTPQDLRTELDRIGPLRARNADLFHGTEAEDLDLTDVPDGDRAAVREAYRATLRMARRHPGLRLDEVLADPQTGIDGALAEISRRLGLVDRFRALNGSRPLLSLDTLGLHPDGPPLEFGDLDDHDRSLVVAEIQGLQRIHRVTGTAEHTVTLLESGYRAALDVAGESRSAFVESVSLPADIASQYHSSAQRIVARSLGNAGAILEQADGLRRIPLGGEIPGGDELLNRLPGFANLFGRRDSCRCRHCRSILGPAAYFVDLMEFVRKHVLDEHFTGDAAGTALDLRVRRPDLWNGLSLTCENTRTRVPYLGIVNEVLENHIHRAAHGPDLPLPERPALEDDVYGRLHRVGEPGEPPIRGFRQPFLVALDRLAIYLTHFPMTRGDVVSVLRRHAEDAAAVEAEARLGLSAREAALVRDPRTDPDFLTALYGFDRPEEDPLLLPDTGPMEDFEPGRVLAPMQVTRAEFGELVGTHFVNGGSTPRISIRSVRRDAGSVQPDAELVSGLDRPSLDRLHRFTRLLRRTPWSVRELDLLIRHASMVEGEGGLSLPTVSRLLAIQARLEIGVPELAALAGAVPQESVRPGDEALFDTVFNLDPFAREQAWPPPAGERAFRHPGFRDGGTPDERDVRRQQRLLAGLQLDDDALVRLLAHLADGLDADASGRFELTPGNLSLLYRHARLSKRLRLPMAEFLRLLDLADDLANPWIEDLAGVEAVLRLHDDWRSGPRTLDALARAVDAPVSDPDAIDAPEAVLERILARVNEDRPVHFADTLFAHGPGPALTEDESRRIVALNHAGYFVPESVEPGTVAIEVPDSIWRERGLSGPEPIVEALRVWVSAHRRPGTPAFLATDLTEIPSIDPDGAQEIVRANPELFRAVPVLFEPADGDLFRATPAFDQTSTLLVPAGISLSPEEAWAFVSDYHASELVPALLAGELGMDRARLRALARLAGHDLDDPDVGAELAGILHADRPPELLLHIIDRVQRLGPVFADPAFTPEAIAFVEAHGGTPDAIFPYLDARTPGIDAWEPTLAEIRMLSTYAALLAAAGAERESLERALLGFDAGGSRRFLDEAVEALALALDVEVGLVSALNRIIPFPTPDPGSPDPTNPAVEAARTLSDAVDLARSLGVGGDALGLLASRDPRDLDRAADAVFAAFRTRYVEEGAWRETVEPFEDAIRERRRDALTDYILRTLDPERFGDRNDLYHWFLIDTELEGCARTSRVVAGISSLQLYVQRCLLGLERSVGRSLHVGLSDEATAEWEWRRNYRVWEANRKVFLWPENYLEPGLRDDRTPLFREMEAELLQRPIEADHVEEAYANYLRGFEELSRLTIGGAYHDYRPEKGRDVLHLFGATSSDPPVHHHRTIENLYLSELPGSDRGVVWNPWEPLGLSIPARRVSPVVHRDRLHVFWIEIASRPTSPFDGYVHRRTLKTSTLRSDGSWSPPQTLGSETHGTTLPDPLASEREFAAFRTTLLSENLPVFQSLYPLLTEGFFANLTRVTILVLERIREDVRRAPSLVERAAHPVDVEVPGFEEEGPMVFTVDMRAPVVRALLVPELEVPSVTSPASLHLEAIDDYTLTDERWTRAFPSPTRPEDLPAPDTVAVSLWSGTGWSVGPLDRYRRRLGDPVEDGVLFFPTRARRLFLLGPRPGSGFFSGLVRDVHAGDAGSVSMLRPYAHALDLSRSAGRLLERRTAVLTEVPVAMELSLVNGTLSDAVVDIEGDSFLLHVGADHGGYILKRLGTSLGERIGRRLSEKGIGPLLDVEFQEGLQEAGEPFHFQGGAVFNDVRNAVLRGVPDFTGPLGVHFREIFFHVPFLIATRLQSEGRFADAQRWYHYIFDPTAGPPSPADPGDEGTDGRASRHVWQYVEFRQHTIDSVLAALRNPEAFALHLRDPFNPHGIARHRLGAYMVHVFMRYVDNLLDWGDHLFAQDTMESINEATLLYVMAADLLGKRPVELGECREEMPHDATYEAIRSRMERCSRRGIEVLETATDRDRRDADAGEPPAGGRDGTGGDTDADEEESGNLPRIPGIDPRDLQGPIPGWGVGGGPLLDPDALLDALSSFGTSILQQSCEFCLPENPELLAYWDRVEDRLFKIRNCMNLSGVRRELALFAPEIDPRLLVRARAAGLSIADVLGAAGARVPPYRFSFLVARAREHAASVQSFGGALLSALEKRDSDELARLRLAHQRNILSLTTRVHEQEVAAAEAALEGFRREREHLARRRDADRASLGRGLGSWEKQLLDYKLSAKGFKVVEGVFETSAAIAAVGPAIVGAANSTPNAGLKESLQALAKGSKAMAEHIDFAAQIIEIQGKEGDARRALARRVSAAGEELRVLDTRILAQEIRREVALQRKRVHEQEQAHLDEVFDFYRERVSGASLYTWLATTLQRLHRDAYQSAHALARLAERAYRFERMDDTTALLTPGAWDGTRHGLLAGERLLLDLRRMEQRFLETNDRRMEIVQPFPLSYVDPDALGTLRETGFCEAEIPEFFFDLYYPGHFHRRIRGVRLTVRCDAGRATNVAATLSLLGSAIRTEPRIGPDALHPVPPTRSVTTATSSGIEDAGVFHLDFRADRYMPFEGAGAVSSRWRIALPQNFRAFDYGTIEDVVLRISYESKYDGLLAERVEAEHGSLRAEFPDDVFAGGPGGVFDPLALGVAYRGRSSE